MPDENAARLRGARPGRPVLAGHGDDAPRRVTAADALLDARDRGDACRGVELRGIPPHLAPGHPERVGGAGDLLEQLHRRDAGADDDDAEPCERVGRDVVVHVELTPPERLGAGGVRPERPSPRAGRVDDVPRRPVAVIGLDDQSPVRVVVGAADRPHLDGTPHLQVEATLVRGEVGGEHLARRRGWIGRRHREAGELVDAVDRRHPQRRPSVLPRAARRRLRVEHHERGRIRVARGRCRRAVERRMRHEAASAQVIGRRQPRLPRADHDDVDRLRFHTLCNARARPLFPPRLAPPAPASPRLASPDPAPPAECARSRRARPLRTVCRG